jgi:hypothetical protein
MKPIKFALWYSVRMEAGKQGCHGNPHMRKFTQTNPTNRVKWAVYDELVEE